MIYASHFAFYILHYLVSVRGRPRMRRTRKLYLETLQLRNIRVDTDENLTQRGQRRKDSLLLFPFAALRLCVRLIF